MLTTLTLVAAVVIFIFYRAAFNRPTNFPPGPAPYPIVGNALSILINQKKSFKKLQEKFGDVYSFRILGKWIVMVSDPQIIKSAAADMSASGRPDLYVFLHRNFIISGKEQNLGIIGTSGDIWLHQRRFTLRSLRDQGFGKHSIEPIMQNELQELGQFVSSKGSQKISVGKTFNRSIINVIWAMVMGKRFSYGDHRLDHLVSKVNKMVQFFNPLNPALNSKTILKWFPNLNVYKNVYGSMEDLLIFLEGEMQNYLKEMDDNDDPGSYLGVYLKEMKEAERQGVESPLTLHHLKANIVELFVAGSETTSSTLWWSIYFMATNPKIQQKIQQELDDVIGPDNIPTFDHIDKLPYTTAAIYEIQRKGDLVPFGIPHYTTEDTTIGGYDIPKGTDILFHLCDAHSNPKYWKYPEKFYPEHFLTPEGQVYKPDAFLPFGSGKRVCLGQSLARLELFLFFTNLVHRFSWKLSDDPVIWKKGTIINTPPDFSVLASRRHKIVGEMKSN